MEVYKLTIEKESGYCVSICGSEEVLRAEIQAWEDHCRKHSEAALAEASIGGEYHEKDSCLVRQVHGYYDCAQRDPQTIAYRFLEVVGMSLVAV